MAETTKTLNGRSISDNVWSIPPDKHASRLNNYNVGNIELAVIVNRTCPRKKAIYCQDSCTVLNQDMAKNLDEDIRNKFLTIPNFPGICMQPIEMFSSNYFFVPDPVEDKILQSVVATNVRSRLNSSLVDVYKGIQSCFGWMAIDGLYDNPGSQDTKVTGNNSTYFYKGATFGHRDFPEQTENIVETSETATPLSAFEMGNGRIQYVLQQSLSPCDQGLHWGVESTQPISYGEDFSIRFRWMADVPDNKNVAPKPFDNKSLALIDAQADIQTTFPYNYGLGIHNLKFKEDNNKIVLESRSVDNASKAKMTLNNQAYIVLSFKVPENVFIVLSQRGGAQAFIENNKRSYCIGKYDGLDGGKLFIKDAITTVQIRNHLGALIITFDGNNQNPWIIQPPIKYFKEDVIVALAAGQGVDSTKLMSISNTPLKIEEGSLKIYGGNISTAFCYSSLKYPNIGTLAIPDSENSYSLPYIGVDKINLSLDDSTGKYSCDAGFAYNSTLPIISSQNVKNYTLGSPSSLEVAIVKDNSNQTGRYERIHKLSANFIKQKIIPTEQSVSYSVAIVFESCDIYKTVTNKTFTTIITLKNRITPIAHCIHITSLPKDELAWTPSGVDVSNNVMSLSLSSQAQDFHSITTTGSIKFLVNWNMPTINMNNGTSQWTVDTNAIARTIESYADKTFYIEIWGAYFTPGSCTTYTQIGSNSTPSNEWFKLFTGLAMGGSLEEKAGERTLSCQLSDYSKILQESQILNGPFLDGVEASIAINTLLKRLNFSEKLIAGNGTDSDIYGPTYWINKQSLFMAEKLTKDSKEIDKYSGINFTFPDTRSATYRRYALPSSYNIFKEPFIKPADGSYYWPEITNIAKKAGSLVFFDQYGCLRFIRNPYDEYLFATTTMTSEVAAQAANQALWRYTRSPVGNGQLVFESLTREKSMIDCINTIKMMTGSPYGELNLANKTNFDSLFDPNFPGFIGYLKMYLQNEGIFGSAESLVKAINHYSKFFYPPTIYKVQSFGLPVMCLDLAELDGNPFIITSVSSEFDKSQNKWWQTIEGEWYGPPANQS